MVSPALLKMIQANKSKFARSGGKAHKFKEGRTRVRILPALTEDAEFHQPLALHWIKPSEEAKPLCVIGDVEYTFPEREQFSEITPLIQAAIDAAKAAGDEEGFKLYKSWLPRKSILVNGLIRDTADASEDPKAIEMGPTLFSDIMGAIELYAVDDVPVYALDLKEGFDFIVERKGKGLDTEYTVFKAPSSKPVAKGVMEKIVDLKAYVEKEYFRGEEGKAIAAIGKITGMTSSAALVAPRGTAMLTSRAAAAKAAPEPELVEAVEEVEVIAPKAKAPAKAPPKAAPAPATAPAAADLEADVDPSDLDAMLGELDGLVA